MHKNKSFSARSNLASLGNKCWQRTLEYFLPDQHSAAEGQEVSFSPIRSAEWWLSSVSDSPSRRQDTSLTPSGLSNQLPPDLLQQVSIFPIRSATVVERHSIVLRTQLGYANAYLSIYDYLRHVMLGA